MGSYVAQNVRRLRRAHDITVYELSDKLKELERPMTAAAISAVERQERRVDVGDLVSLALVLGVSPVTLMMPPKPDEDDEPIVMLNEHVGAPWELLWRWMHGEQPITGGVGSSREFIAANRPYEKEIGTELARFLATRKIERPYVVTARATKAGPIEVEIRIVDEDGELWRA